MHRWPAGCGNLNAEEEKEEQFRLSINSTVNIVDTKQAIENVRDEVQSHLKK